jgi:hypothetical protein
MEELENNTRRICIEDFEKLKKRAEEVEILKREKRIWTKDELYKFLEGVESKNDREFFKSVFKNFCNPDYEISLKYIPNNTGDKNYDDYWPSLIRFYVKSNETLRVIEGLAARDVTGVTDGVYENVLNLYEFSPSKVHKQLKSFLQSFLFEIYKQQIKDAQLRENK